MDVIGREGRGRIEAEVPERSSGRRRGAAEKPRRLLRSPGHFPTFLLDDSGREGQNSGLVQLPAAVRAGAARTPDPGDGSTVRCLVGMRGSPPIAAVQASSGLGWVPALAGACVRETGVVSWADGGPPDGTNLPIFRLQRLLASGIRSLLRSRCTGGSVP